MVYLVKMNLVTMADDSTSGPSGETIHLVYEVAEVVGVAPHMRGSEVRRVLNASSYTLLSPR